MTRRLGLIVFGTLVALFCFWLGQALVPELYPGDRAAKVAGARPRAQPEAFWDEALSSPISKPSGAGAGLGSATSKAPSSPSGGPTPPHLARASIAPLVRQVKDSVVTIQSTKIERRFVQEGFGLFGFGLGRPRQREERIQGLGSGFIVDAEGTILTNNHVVAGADEVQVVLSNRQAFEAKVLGSDPSTDVAVVKILNPPRGLQTVQFGDSERLHVGDYVVAIGNPLGLGQTVTMGIVSAKNRVLDGKIGDVEERFQDFIQTDAAINQGNSGGPLFDFQGRVVGINSAILDPAKTMNVGFAIPINLARRIADQLVDSGKVVRGFLGIKSGAFSQETAQALGVDYVPGALITEVTRNSPADAGGLRPGDVVVEVNGRRIEEERGLPPVVASFPPGATLDIVYLRRGRKSRAKVKLAPPPKPKGRQVLGMWLRPLDRSTARKVGLDPGNGAEVVAVDLGGCQWLFASKGHHFGYR